MTRVAVFVNDLSSVNETITAWLIDLGFDSIRHLSTTEAKSEIPQLMPELVLLCGATVSQDLQTLCRHLKWDRQTNLIPILVIVGEQAGSQDEKWSIRVGANAYLEEPIDQERFSKAVSNALTWRDEHHRLGTSGEIRFDLRSHQSYLHQLNDLLTDLYAHTPLTERQVKDLQQAVLEMGNNAIEWGHKKNVDLVLEVTYRIDPQRITLILSDQGEGFDPNDLDHAASEDDPLAHVDVRNELGLREGGFGIMLSRGLVDHFAYNEKGNTVTLVKEFRKAEVDEAP